MDKIVILDPESGDKIQVPVTEFLKHGFLSALKNERQKEVNLTALIRVIQEKAKTKFRKAKSVQLLVDDKVVEMKIPVLAKAALFSYSDREIEELFADKMLANDLESAISSCLPDELQPSTSSQRTLALRIAEIVDINLGYELLASKQNLSVFISKNQHELDRYEQEIEGHEFVSDRVSEALIMFFELISEWEKAFNIAFELYLQLPQKGRDLVNTSLQVSLSDNYWNESNEQPESLVAGHVLKNLSFKHNREQSFSNQFKELHKVFVYNK